MNFDSFNPYKILIIIICTIGLLPTIIPLYITYSNESYQIYFYCLFSIILGIGLFLTQLKSQKIALRITVIDIIVFLWILYIVFYQLMFEQHIDKKIINRSFASGIIYLFAKENKNKINILFDVFIVNGLIEVIIVLFEIVNLHSFFPDSIHTINGSFGNPNVVAIFLAVLLPISLYRYRTATKIRLLYLLLTMLFLLLITITKCRSAILLSVFSIFVFVFQSYSKVGIAKLAVSALIICCLLTVFIVLSFSKKDSNISRKLIWQASFEMILKKPITGYGFSNFEKEYNLYQSIYLTRDNTTETEKFTAGYILQPYNEFLYSLFVGGFFYFFLYLAFFICSIYCLKFSFRNQDNFILFTVSTSLVGLFLTSLYSYTYYLPIIEIFLFLHLGILGTYLKTLKSLKIAPKISLLILILFVLFMGYFTGRGVVNNFRVSKLIEIPIDEVQNKIKEFDKLYSSNKTNPLFLYNYSLLLIKEKRINDAISILKEAKQYSSYYQIYYVAGVCYTLIEDFYNAEKNYETAISLFPSKFQPNYALFKLYIQYNKIDQAKIIARRINDMPVKINSTKIQKIKKEADEFYYSKSNNL